MADKYRNRDGRGQREKPALILRRQGSPNLGLLYYKTPFRELADPSRFDQVNQEVAEILLEQNLANYTPAGLDISAHFTSGAPDGAYAFFNFELTTNYPGLAVGLGYSHGTKRSEQEFKLGFFFDHTTGVPLIPGSSIKGRLRSFFPGRYSDEKRRKEVAAELLGILADLKKNGLIQSEISGEQELQRLENTIFQGENLEEMGGALIQDTFFDAFPARSDNPHGHFLGTGAITPHEHPLKEPNPLRILKLLPEVSFRFQFRLNKYGGLMAEEKKVLFHYLLQEYGMGAKTASGFGQFKDTRQLEAIRMQFEHTEGYLAGLPALSQNKAGKTRPASPADKVPAPEPKEEKLGPDEAVATLVGNDPVVAGKKLFKLEDQKEGAEQVVSIRYFADAKTGRKAVLHLQYDKKRKHILSATLKRWLD